ncbi:MAG: aminotransferase class IV family protein [Phycisphaerae bacterium]|nr:aminotransferase class IV family protein [Phycisphaerae bacterium]
MAQKVFLNNELVDVEKAAISVADSGLLYGAGLFETMRSRNGVVFRVEDHLDRLFFSAAALSIDHSFDKPCLLSALDRVLEANDLKDARLRLTLTNGPLAESEDQRRPTLLITATEFRPYPSDYYNTGVLVVLCPFRQNPTDPTCGHKTTNYYPRLLALNLAHRRRAAEALWFATDNRLAEGCISNVFLVKDSVLYTPSVQTPVLPGIARKTVLQVAKEQSIEAVEKDLYIADLLGADEVFLTNIVMEVLPVTHIEQHAVGNGNVGSVTQRLRESFVVAVEQECGRQP